MTDRVWELEFGVEVSARYHEWRRDSLEFYDRLVKAATFIGAIVTLLTAFGASGDYPSWIIIAVFSIIVAAVNLWDLAANTYGRAIRHTDLYKRFKELQAEIAEGRVQAEEHLPIWEAKAQRIRIEEPPVMWAIYAMCWNQTVERHGAERKGFHRPVSWCQSWAGRIMQFRPQDFPAEA